MSAFPIIDQYRAELRAMPYKRVNGEGMVELRRRRANAHQSNAIEGIHPTPELEALFAMFHEERVPPDVSGPYVHPLCHGADRARGPGAGGDAV